LANIGYINIKKELTVKKWWVIVYKCLFCSLDVSAILVG